MGIKLPSTVAGGGGVIIVLLLLLHLITPSAAGTVATEFLPLNFTASYYTYIDTGGVFLTSPNDTFNAAVANPGNQLSNFYLSVVHTLTNTVVWSANRNSPISNSGTVFLSATGLTVSDHRGTLRWSTPSLSAAVKSLRLIDDGNLVLLDANNGTLWQSFDHPTDTLVTGQRLPKGGSLIAAVSNVNLSEGNFSLAVTGSDAIMSWVGSQQYWRLSMDSRSVQDEVSAVSYMAANATGLYLFSDDGEAVFQILLPPSNFRIMKVDTSGRFQIKSYNNSISNTEEEGKFTAPSSDCELPFYCNTLGLCSIGSNGSSCSCPNSFGAAKSSSGGCSPADGSSLVGSNSSSSSCSNPVSYLSLGSGIDYFGIKFSTPTTSGEELSACRGLCSANCSCLGFYYNNSSRSCYILQHQLGSVSISDDGDAVNRYGYIKTLATESQAPPASSTSKMGLIAILLPSMAAFLLIVVLSVVGPLWWRRMKRRMRIRSISLTKEIRLGRQKSWLAAAARFVDGESGDESDEISIPGLPTRFSLQEMESATDGFKLKIGSGGFGDVYKGELPDKSTVAVKHITGVGAHHRRDFCTEIAVIGKVHHVNLVRLRGFCAERAQRLLVYEYMNRGSLDRSLFGPGPVLEWQERVEIAVGASKGLAYLHSGCDQRIVHCDVKPENILLHDGGQVKIADFGLAKLLTPEQSGRFTTMRGTRGYLAPEWLTNTAITDKTDVYSFGMVLLEIVRGRKNRSQESEDQTTSGSGSGPGQVGFPRAGGGGYFPVLALEMHEQGRYAELADRRLEGRVTLREVGRVVRVALCCLHEDPATRPSMTEVTAMLEGTMEACEPRVESLMFLRLYGLGFESVAPGAVAGAGERTHVRDLNVSSTSSTPGSQSRSYVTSQQVSGPR